MIRRLLLLMSLVLLAATVAEAQLQRPSRPQLTRMGRWDFSLQTRYTTYQTISRDDGSSLTLNEDLGWGFGFGYNFSDNFNLGLAFTWRSIPYDATIVDATDPENVNRYSSNLSTSTIGLTGEWNILDGPITPYVNGSLAWMFIDTNVFAGWGSGCWWDPWWGYICGDMPMTYGTNTGSYGLGLGLRCELTEAFFVRAGYEYGWIGSGPVDGSNMLRIDIGLTN